MIISISLLYFPLIHMYICNKKMYFEYYYPPAHNSNHPDCQKMTPLKYIDMLNTLDIDIDELDPRILDKIRH